MTQNDVNRSSIEKRIDFIYRKHGEEIWRFLISRGNTSEEAYDLLHTIFTRLIQILAKGKNLDEVMIRPYLYTMAKNLSIDEFKKRYREIHMLQNLSQNQRVSHEDDYSQDPGAIDQLIKSALNGNKLSERQKDIISYKVFARLGIKEISQIIHVSQRTIRRELKKAEEILREIFKSEGYHWEDFE